jgi:hypothetical protein
MSVGLSVVSTEAVGHTAASVSNVPLYLATRHWFGWFALNVLELPPHVIALQLGHQDGGRLVRELYGHPDAAMARECTREAFHSVAPVQALRVSAVGGA